MAASVLAWTQADGGVVPQSDVPALFVDYDSLDRGLGVRWSDLKVEAVSVAMPTGVPEGLD